MPGGRAPRWRRLPPPQSPAGARRAEHRDCGSPAGCELIALYGHLLDQRRWEDLNQVFTPDVRFEGLHDTTTGIDAKVALWISEEGMKRHPLAHHATNVVITQDPDGTVRIISKGIGVRASGEPQSVTYRDIAVRTPAGWRIAARRAISRRTEAEELRREGRP